MKTNPFIQLVSVSIILSFAYTTVYAQVPPQFKADYNKMMRNSSMQYGQHLSHYRNPHERTNPKYNFIVLFKDSSIKTVSSQIHLDKLTQTYYLLQENRDLPKSDPARKQKIYAKETVKITRLITIDKIPIDGIATDSCWLFKVLSGKINAYSEYAEISGVDATYITAIKVGSADIELLIPEKLEMLISKDEKAYRAFKKQWYYVAIERFNKGN